MPEPALSLTTEASGDLTIGQTYSLTCNVTEIIDGLTDSPVVEWLNDTGTVMDLSVADSGTSASQRITFNPLQTSHAGEYTCRATLVSPSVEGGTITMVAVQSVTVESKQTSVCACMSFRRLCIDIWYYRIVLVLQSLLLK